MRLIPLLTLCLTLAPADAARAGGDGPVVEIVTFRLIAGADEGAFRQAAAATDAVLRTNPAYGARVLSRDEAGLWTDVVRWSSLTAAEAAAAGMMTDPAFGPFLSLIDPATVQMRHAQVIWSRD